MGFFSQHGGYNVHMYMQYMAIQTGNTAGDGENSM